MKPGVYEVSMRDYRVGDIDDFQLDGGRESPDSPYVDPAWQAAIAANSSDPIAGLDRLSANQNVAFTALYQLAGGERAIHAYLAMSLKQSGDETASDFVQLFDMSPEHKLNFGRYGWSGQINATTPYVAVIDMGRYLDQLQTGSVNVLLSDDVGMDWALYAVAVATPKDDPVGAAVFIDGGSVLVDGQIAPIASLSVAGIDPANLTLGQSARLTVRGDYVQGDQGTLSIEIGGTSEGQFGKLAVGGTATLNGALNVTFLDGFMPGPGDSFQILSAGALVGTFSNTPGNLLSTAFGDFMVAYTPDAVILSSFIGQPVPGDYNLDGRVDTADYVVWRNHLGTNLALPNEGASPRMVDQADFDFWKANFGKTASDILHEGTAVPEPTTFAILLMSIAGGFTNLVEVHIHRSLGRAPRRPR